MSETSYKSMGGRSFMLFTCSESGKNIDTQMRMLAAGGMKAILPMIPTSKNGEAILQYDITGLTRLSGITQYGKLSCEQFSALIEGLVSAFDDCNSYTLSTDGVILHSDNVYFDLKSGAVRFVYIPTLRGGSQFERYREMLRALIAFGNVEPCTLTATITNVINSPSFTINDLREILRNHNTGYLYEASPNPATWRPSPRTSKEPSLPIGELRKNIIAAVANMEDFEDRESRFFDGEYIKVITVSVIAVASLTLIIAACFALSVGRLDISLVSFVLILLCTVDYFILRKYILNVSNSSGELEAADTENLTEEKPNKQDSTTNPLSVADPVYTVPAQAPSVYVPPVSPASYAPRSVSRTSLVEPDYNTYILDESDDETFVADEPDTGLYLETADGEEIALSKSPFLLGRDSTLADYRLSDKTIGRKHAELTNSAGSWVITDQNSRNHTYLNGNCLDPYTSYPISEGDEIRLAKVAILWVKSR